MYYDLCYVNPTGKLKVHLVLKNSYSLKVSCGDELCLMQAKTLSLALNCI